MRKVLGILLALTITVGSYGASVSDPCAFTVLRDSAINQSRLLRLPPRSTRPLIAMLLETQFEDQVLTFSHYLGDHTAMATRAILDFARGDEYADVTHYLWAGEVIVKNTTDREAIGVVDVMNETSGFLAGLLKSNHLDGAKVINNAAMARLILSSKIPWLFSPLAEVIPFDEKNKHLIESPSEVRHAMPTSINHILDYARKKAFALPMTEQKKEELERVQWAMEFLQTDWLVGRDFSAGIGLMKKLHQPPHALSSDAEWKTLLEQMQSLTQARSVISESSETIPIRLSSYPWAHPHARPASELDD